MRLVTALALLGMLPASVALAEEPGPVAEPPAGSIKLKTTEAEAVTLDEQAPVTGKVQKPTVDVLMVSDPVKPAIEPPKRSGEPGGR